MQRLFTILEGSAPKDAAQLKLEVAEAQQCLAQVKISELNASNEQGETLLTLAARNNHSHVTALLLEKKADVDVPHAKTQDTPIKIADDKGHKHVIRLLRGAREGLMPLHSYVVYHDLEGARFILDSKVDPDAEATQGQRAIILAAENGNTVMLDLLLEAKANIEVVDRNQRHTALTRALQHENKNLQMVKALVAHKANVTRTFSSLDRTPVQIAVGRNSVEDLRVLLAAKATPNVLDDRMRSPLKEAQEMGKSGEHLVRVLLEANADPNFDSDSQVGRNFNLTEAKQCFAELLKKGELLEDFPPTELWRLQTECSAHARGPNYFRAKFYRQMNAGFKFITQHRKETKISAATIESIYQHTFKYEITPDVFEMPLGFRANVPALNLNLPLSNEGADELAVALIKTHDERKRHPRKIHWRLFTDNHQEIEPKSNLDELKKELQKHVGPSPQLFIFLSPVMRNEVFTFVQDALDLFYREIARLRTQYTDEVLFVKTVREITRLARLLNQYHVFADGNGRALIILMQNLLLMQLLNKIMILLSPEHFIGYSISELTLENCEGIDYLQRFKVTNLVKVVSQLSAAELTTAEEKNNLRKIHAGTTRNPNIALAQLSEVFQRVYEGTLVVSDPVKILALLKASYLGAIGHAYKRREKDFLNFPVEKRKKIFMDAILNHFILTEPNMLVTVNQIIDRVIQENSQQNNQPHRPASAATTETAATAGQPSATVFFRP